MPQYEITVKVVATCSYTVTVDARDEAQAESEAISRYATECPEDFQVEKGYIEWELDTDQLTADCPDCFTEHVIPHNNLRTCHCGQFTDSEERYKRQHILVDGVCAPAPWWSEDQEYCAACGARIKAAELARDAARKVAI
jgi:hypothetical protein